MARAYPLLASDIARSRICAIVAVPPLVIAVIVARRGGMPFEVLIPSAIILAWALFAVVYSVLTVSVFVNAGAESLYAWLRAAAPPRSRMRRVFHAVNGEGAIWWALSGGVISLTAVILLVGIGTDQWPFLLWLGVFELSASWALIVVSFAVLYAREHVERGHIDFPGDAQPRFVDFLYLAVQVSTTFSSSDVSLSSVRARVFVSLHAVIAFVFNTVIVAVLVAVLIG